MEGYNFRPGDDGKGPNDPIAIAQLILGCILVAVIFICELALLGVFDK